MGRDAIEWFEKSGKSLVNSPSKLSRSLNKFMIFNEVKIAPRRPNMCKNNFQVMEITQIN